MGDRSRFPLRSDFLKNIATPHFYWFAPNRLLSRSADCGLAGLRHFGASGRHRCGQILTDSFLLLVLMLICAVHAYGRRLAVEAIIVACGRFGGAAF